VHPRGAEKYKSQAKLASGYFRSGSQLIDPESSPIATKCDASKNPSSAQTKKSSCFDEDSLSSAILNLRILFFPVRMPLMNPVDCGLL